MAFWRKEITAKMMLTIGLSIFSCDKKLSTVLIDSLSICWSVLTGEEAVAYLSN